MTNEKTTYTETLDISPETMVMARDILKTIRANVPDSSDEIIRGLVSITLMDSRISQKIIQYIEDTLETTEDIIQIIQNIKKNRIEDIDQRDIMMYIHQIQNNLQMMKTYIQGIIRGEEKYKYGKKIEEER